MVNSPHKGQWGRALLFSLNCIWINSWVNNRKAGDLRRHHAYYDVKVMIISILDLGAVCVPSNGVGSTRLHRTPALQTSVLWVNPSQATITDINLDTFRPCLSRPSFPSRARKQKVSVKFDTGHGMLYMSISIKPFYESFFSKYSQKTLHISSMTASFGVHDGKLWSVFCY